MKKEQEQKQKQSEPEGKIEGGLPVGVGDQLKQALYDCKEAQIQRDFLRDKNRAIMIICPLCRHSQRGERKPDGAYEAICPRFKRVKGTPVGEYPEREQCQWLRAITQCIPVTDGVICKDVQYLNPNMTFEGKE